MYSCLCFTSTEHCSCQPSVLPSDEFGQLQVAVQILFPDIERVLNSSVIPTTLDKQTLAWNGDKNFSGIEIIIKYNYLN